MAATSACGLIGVSCQEEAPCTSAAVEELEAGCPEGIRKVSREAGMREGKLTKLDGEQKLTTTHQIAE